MEAPGERGIPSAYAGGGRVRWIVPIGYVAASLLLLVPVVLYANGGDGGRLQSAAELCVLLLMVANIVQCLAMHVCKAPGRRVFSRCALLLIKLGLIPFFCMGALAVAFSALLALHPVLFMAGLFMTPLLLACGWLAMMGGSCWAMAYALGLRRDGLISTGECAVHVVAQLFFVADVADGIVLFVRGRRLEGLRRV